MAVAGESEAVVEMRLGSLVLDVAAGVEIRQASSNAVCSVLIEQVEGHRPGIVGLEQFRAFVTELVPLGCERLPLLLLIGVELVELPDEQVAERGHDVSGYLDALLVLDRGLHVRDVECLLLAVGALGVPSGADEVGETLPWRLLALVSMSRDSHPQKMLPSP